MTPILNITGFKITALFATINIVISAIILGLLDPGQPQWPVLLYGICSLIAIPTTYLVYYYRGVRTYKERIIDSQLGLNISLTIEQRAGTLADVGLIKEIVRFSALKFALFTKADIRGLDKMTIVVLNTDVIKVGPLDAMAITYPESNVSYFTKDNVERALQYETYLHLCHLNFPFRSEQEDIEWMKSKDLI